MKKVFFIALLIAFSAHNNFGMFNLYESLVKSGSNAITNLQYLGGSVIERLQDSSKTKPIALGLVTCIAAYYTIKKYLINKKDQNGLTPLHKAAISGHKGIVQALLDRGANREAADRFGATPLNIAANNGHEDVVVLLLDRGANREAANIFGEPPLHRAAICGHEGVVQALLDGGAEVNATNNNGETPLHYAAICGHEGVVQALLDGGAKVDAANIFGEPPLHRAAICGHEGVVQALLDGGAKVDAANIFGDIPLHIAASKGHEDVVVLLLDRGAKVNATNNNGETPLHYAAYDGDEEVVELLTAAPIILKQPNNANSELSEETLKKLDDYYSQVFSSIKELHGPVAKSITKNMFPIKEDDQKPILRALLKLSYQDLKDNPEQGPSAFANLFIHGFYKNHLSELKLYIAIQNRYQKTAIDKARANRKDNIVNYLEATSNTKSYDELKQDLKAQTERNYQHLVGYKKLA